MAAFGYKLRHKRMAMGLSLKDAAKQAKIKQKYLKALEDEDVLKFSDKAKIIVLIRQYAYVLNLDEKEVLNDFNILWSDSSTAKAYLQQSFSKNKKGVLGERKVFAYGSVALAALLFLSVGSYLVWSNLFDQDDPRDMYLSSAEEETDIEENGTTEHDSHDEMEENIYASHDEEPDEPGEAKAEEGIRDEEGIDEEVIKDEEVEVEADEEKKEEKEENETKETTASYEQAGSPVPRTDGDKHLIYTGGYFIIAGLLLLLSSVECISNRLFKTTWNYFK